MTVAYQDNFGIASNFLLHLVWIMRYFNSLRAEDSELPGAQQQYAILLSVLVG
jgi:hypothetical protein